MPRLIWSIMFLVVVARRIAGATPTRGAPAFPVGLPECEALREVEVCSHRGRGLDQATSSRGLLASLGALWEGDAGAGIPPTRCFDVDLTATADGTLLVGHPGDLHPGVHEALIRLGHEETEIKSGLALRVHSFADLRSAEIGLTEDAWPTLSALLLWLKARLGEAPGQERGRVLVALEVKPRLDEATLRTLLDDVAMAAGSGVALAGALGIWYHLDITAGALTSLRELQTTAAPEIRAIGAVRARADWEPDVPATDWLETRKRASFDLLGPSVELPMTFLSSIRTVYGLEAFAWTVDSEKHFWKAVQAGVRYLVSNYPVWLHLQVVESSRWCTGHHVVPSIEQSRSEF